MTASPAGSAVSEPVTLVQAVDAALEAELAADPRVVLLGEDIGRMGGVFRATAGLQAHRGPGTNRVAAPLAPTAGSRPAGSKRRPGLAGRQRR
jgi:pyruvate/2-oxoglutarate/acetoin dehydrogenase E1 component